MGNDATSSPYTCSTKVAFEGAAVAHAAARRRAKRGRPGKAYRCKICGFWHIGRMGKNMKETLHRVKEARRAEVEL